MHYPVMLPEVLAAMAPRDGQAYVDGTFGNGGYSEAILRAADCRVIALDRDPSVRPRARVLEKTYGSRFRLIETPFSAMADLELGPVNAVVLDIGVSSMQIDRADRGFSFQKSGPLDMRMGADGPSAADAVRELDEDALAHIFRLYGEERQARRAAKLIKAAGDLTTTDVLAELIEGAFGRPKGPRGKTHPATRIFQALRIYVNDELGELYRALVAAEAILVPGGRLVIVTFHSLEDRIVKTFLRDRAGEVRGGSRYAPEVVQTGPAPTFVLDRRKTLKPSAAELSENPRSRSAKLRVATRTQAPARPADPAELERWPSARELAS